ncbi:hypothetical protein HaLaN_24156 [Haematococcus lacustris]|uniref:Uncharacterized protein n=1 Tax=Haematococcus lacustris TaxID=44745 RepID=A0A699ZUG7_HAELA|nr:hypothetical protein HaLaN_24156 [Haematococcus lacustris]
MANYYSPGGCFRANQRSSLSSDLSTGIVTPSSPHKPPSPLTGRLAPSPWAGYFQDAAARGRHSGARSCPAEAARPPGTRQWRPGGKG